ncbi:MAG: MFS transporter [Christensenellaceae bacterium]|jgi:Na+/melibiose symporter-like transporter|nr:MFS transporter [Christensenellaceae bacterium]
MMNPIKSIKKYWKHPGEGRYLSIKEILFFGAGCLGVNFIITTANTLITSNQIPEIYGIDVIHGIIIFIIASSAGIFTQTAFGKLLHNTKPSKFGKYKRYLYLLVPLVGAFAVAATWLPQDFTEEQRVLFAYFTNIPTLVILNILSNTLNMMPSVITPNQQERTDVWSPVGIIINLAPTLFNVIKGPIRAHFLSRGQEYMTFRVMGIVGIVIGTALTLMLIKARERVYETKTNKEKVKLLEGLKSVVKNRPLMILTLALMLGSLRACVDIHSELIGRLRYGKTFEEGMQTFSMLTLVVGFAATPNMVLLPILTRKFNNRTILLGWQILNTTAFLTLAIIGYSNIPTGTTSAIVITIIRFFALFNAVGSLLPLMLSEIYDYQQWKTGKRLEGFIQTFSYAAVLMVTQLAFLIPVLIQRQLGFNPNNYFDKQIHEVSSATLKTATDYFDIAQWISVVSGILFIIVILFYNLDKKKYAEIVSELKSKNINKLDDTNPSETNEGEPLTPIPQE